MIQFWGNFDKSSASKITTTRTTTKSFLRSLTHYMLAIKNYSIIVDENDKYLLLGPFSFACSQSWANLPDRLCEQNLSNLARHPVHFPIKIVSSFSQISLWIFFLWFSCHCSSKDKGCAAEALWLSFSDNVVLIINKKDSFAHWMKS